MVNIHKARGSLVSYIYNELEHYHVETLGCLNGSVRFEPKPCPLLVFWYIYNELEHYHVETLGSRWAALT